MAPTTAPTMLPVDVADVFEGTEFALTVCPAASSVTEPVTVRKDDEPLSPVPVRVPVVGVGVVRLVVGTRLAVRVVLVEALVVEEVETEVVDTDVGVVITLVEILVDVVDMEVGLVVSTVVGNVDTDLLVSLDGEGVGFEAAIWSTTSKNRWRVTYYPSRRLEVEAWAGQAGRLHLV